MHSVVFILLVYIIFMDKSSGQYDQLLRKELVSLNLAVSQDLDDVKTMWISQPLDHFDKSNTGTWSMRYFQRTNFFKPGGSIVLFIGGEGEANPIWLTVGLSYEVAKETNSALFMSEHRYYGKSLPTEAGKLQYLSSRQALADLACLLKHIKKSDSDYKRSKILIIGGSYPGNMAAWMRLLYPDLVQFALASSGPVLAKLNFFEYLEAVAVNYREYGGCDCYNKIGHVFSRYEKLFQTTEGIAKIKKEENICESSDLSNEYNRYLFMINKISQFMYISQYGSAEEVIDHCRIILAGEQSTKSYSLLSIVNIFTDSPNLRRLGDSENCTGINFDDEIDFVKTDNVYYSWMYQSCAEFGYAQTTESENHPFTNNYPKRIFLRLCEEVYDSGFTESSIEKNIEMTNIMYGGLTIVSNVTNVIFTNFNMDPWHRLSILPTSNFEIVHGNILLFGKNGSHCQDLGSQRRGESPHVTELRKLVMSMLKFWLW